MTISGGTGGASRLFPWFRIVSVCSSSSRGVPWDSTLGLLRGGWPSSGGPPFSVSSIGGVTLFGPPVDFAAILSLILFPKSEFSFSEESFSSPEEQDFLPKERSIFPPDLLDWAP